MNSYKAENRGIRHARLDSPSNKIGTYSTLVRSDERKWINKFRVTNRAFLQTILIKFYPFLHVIKKGGKPIHRFTPLVLISYIPWVLGESKFFWKMETGTISINKTRNPPPKVTLRRENRRPLHPLRILPYPFPIHYGIRYTNSGLHFLDLCRTCLNSPGAWWF